MAHIECSIIKYAVHKNKVNSKRNKECISLVI